MQNNEIFVIGLNHIGVWLSYFEKSISPTESQYNDDLQKAAMYTDEEEARNIIKVLRENLERNNFPGKEEYSIDLYMLYPTLVPEKK